ATSPRPTPPTPWRASTSRWRRTAGPSPATSGSARTSSPRSWTRARTGWTGPSSPTAWPTRRCCMRVFDELCPAPPHWTVRWDEVRAAFGWVRAMAGVPLEEDGRTVARYKWVRPDFLTAILDSGTHWLDRPLVANGLADPEVLYAGVR